MDISFLKIHPVKETAQDLGESANALLRYGGQIQLIPYNPKPYFQVTSGTLNLTVGSGYRVYLVRCWDELEVEITPHVQILQFQENGTYQLKIRIAYLHQDYGTAPCYLKIERFGAADNGLKKYYSNRFIVTADQKELTSRIDYIDSARNIPAVEVSETILGYVQSIQLRFYYNDIVPETEVETYYQLATSQNVNPRISLKEYKEWKTQHFDAWHFTRLSRAFYTGKCYVDFVRNYPVEGLKSEKREGQSNIFETVFITDPDEKDTIYIDNIVIDPPPPPQPYLSSSALPSSNSLLSSAENEY